MLERQGYCIAIVCAVLQHIVPVPQHIIKKISGYVKLNNKNVLYTNVIVKVATNNAAFVSLRV